MENNTSFFFQIFSCCVPKHDKSENNTNVDLIPETKEEEQVEKPVSNHNNEKPPETSQTNDFQETLPPTINQQIFPQKFIQKEEEEVITFTKNGILDFYSKIKNLPYEEVINKNDLLLEINNQGSSFRKDLFVAHSHYIVPKSSFKKAPSIQLIANIIFKPEYRKKWDDSLQIVEIMEQISPEAFIVHTMSKKQLMIISEREAYDKRCEFYHDEIYYNFSSSVPEELYPSNPDAVRVRNYFNFYIIKEDEEKFTFEVYNQVDIKMKVPPSLLKIMFPSRMEDMNMKMRVVINETMK